MSDKSEPAGLIPCYGRYSRKEKKCLGCQVKSYCAEAKTTECFERYRERTNSEVAEALAAYATLPAVYKTPGGQSGQSWEAVLRMLTVLTRLHPTTWQILKLKMQNPTWQRRQISEALALAPNSVRDKISGSRPAAAVFYHPRKERKKVNQNQPIAAGANVYLSGPMSGLPDLNAPAFHQAEEELRERYRCNVVNPIFTSYLMGDDRSHADYLKVSLALVQTSDIVIMLPGWENSVGANAEYTEARRLGKTVFALGEV